jgi:hypothetical protein
MAKGKYLVVDIRGTFPQWHLVDTLKAVRRFLDPHPPIGSYLVFKADGEGKVVEVGLNGRELR